MTPKDQRRILITDDEVAIREDLGEYLSNLGYEVETVSDAASTLSSVAASEYNVLLLDHMLPDTTGLDILPAVLTARPTLSVVVMTGYPTVDMIISAVRRGACDVVVKPFELTELLAAVERAVARNQRLVEKMIDTEETTTFDTACGSHSDQRSRPRVSSRTEV